MGRVLGVDVLVGAVEPRGQDAVRRPRLDGNVARAERARRVVGAEADSHLVEQRDERAVALLPHDLVQH
eukprot:4256752-Prymnesium_polylepis.1